MTKIGILLCVLVKFTFCQTRNHSDEYCNSEVFRPQCSKNDVILMQSATYGRMRVGRCLTAEEVETHRAIAGDDPRYFRCSVDVLEILDQACSGKANCEVRVAEILERNVKPCLAGLMVYLEASYDCITVVDEKRSCTIKPLTDSSQIISSSPQQRICGREFHPWIVESPVGQRISVALTDFNGKVTDGVNRHLCNSYATIVDREGKRNVSICGGKSQRQSRQYVSTGNILEIYFGERTDNKERFLLSLDAVGCSDIIPPEDTWLKRKEDAIVIGCYSNRLTWKLSCSEGKWIGVLGNCSIKENPDNKFLDPKETDASISLSTISYNEQVLAIVAISGCTFAICLVIVCIGIVCLRRFYIRYKSQQDYKTLSLNRNPPEANQQLIGRTTNENGFSFKSTPTYSVYFEDNGFKDTRDNIPIQ